jgi:hypothetical protein
VKTLLMSLIVSSWSYLKESVQVDFVWGFAAILVAGRTGEGVVAEALVESLKVK